jgi:hypothetical protein
MKRFLQGLCGSLAFATAWALITPSATAQIPAPMRSKPVVAPKLSAAKVKPVGPKLQLSGPCGVGQAQCFLGGGKVPASIPPGSPDSVQPKVCAFSGDPAWNCGKCERCVLYKTSGAFCGPKGCDYKACLPNFADLDGNRANGCETWVPIKKPVPPRRPPANMPARACTHDPDCGAPSPDIKCVPRHRGVAGGTCQWWRCQSASECNYLPYAGNWAEGAPACVGGPESDSHGCGYSYPSCRRFNVPGDTGICRADMGVLDADGDGFTSIALTVGPDGVPDGNDCDDGDPTRFPSNTEVCDAYNHDEDCDPTTNGAPDADHDGQRDGACCNLLASGVKSCGTDCDDHNAALALAAKKCLPDGQMQLCNVDTAGGGQVASWVTRACGAGAVCVPQPDGTGVCQLH